MSTIRQGFVTQLDMELFDALRQAADMGFDHIEVMMDGPGERTELQRQQDEIQQMLADTGIDLVVHLPFKLDIGSPLPHVRDGAVKEVKAAIDVATALGAEKGVLHASSNAWGAAWTREHVLDLICTSVQELYEYGQEDDFRVCVENVPGEFADIYDFPYLFEETDAVMTLDTGHARISGMSSADMAAFIADFIDHVDHLHLNDTRQPEDEHLLLGAGNLDIEQILDPLQDDWTGTVSLEVFTDDWEYIRMSKDRLDTML
jgi:sugar phosphate isomerase/epimerase